MFYRILGPYFQCPVSGHHTLGQLVTIWSRVTHVWPYLFQTTGQERETLPESEELNHTYPFPILTKPGAQCREGKDKRHQFP
jgi:hypothetical protein